MFNHKFPSVPTPSLDSLAEALRSPQKAAEVLDAWKVAKEAYEASKADFEAARAEYLKDQKSIEGEKAQLEVEWSELFQAQKLFKGQKDTTLEILEATKKKLEKKEQDLESQNGQLVQYDTALRAKEAALLAETNRIAAASVVRSKELDEREAGLNDWSDKLAAREEKAEKLAALLKGV